MPDHADVVRREFARQARGFGAGSFFAAPALADWVDDGAHLGPDDIVLDAGGGAGDLARTLASRARQIVVADLTDEMRARGAREAGEAGVRNVLFVRAALEDLPFEDGSFDAVLCRFVVHHLPDPAVALAELARVCRADGRVVIADMVVVPGEEGDLHNHFERVRDPSHAGALTEAALRDAVKAAGLAIGLIDDTEQRLDLERWLTQSAPSAAAEREVREAIAAELGGGPATGLRPEQGPGGVITIGHRWLRITASPR